MDNTRIIKIRITTQSSARGVQAVIEVNGWRWVGRERHATAETAIDQAEGAVESGMRASMDHLFQCGFELATVTPTVDEVLRDVERLAASDPSVLERVMEALKKK